jgi:hypothetical protein
MTAAKTVVATTAFAAAVGGQEVLVREGERFTSTHPVVKAYPSWCQDAKPDVKRGSK